MTSGYDMLWNEFDGVGSSGFSDLLCQSAQLMGQCPVPKKFVFTVLDGIINNGLDQMVLWSESMLFLRIF